MANKPGLLTDLAEPENLEFAVRPRTLARAVRWEDPRALEQLCKELNVTAEQLAAAVALVGPMPDALKYYLTQSRGRKSAVTDAVKALGLPPRQVDRRVRRKPG